MNITGKTKLYGIIGNPVSHSLSPILHNYIYKYYNLDAVYVPFLFTPNKNNEKFLLKSLLNHFNILGLSVTIPYKTLAYQIADKKDDISNFTKASNTLIKKDDGIYAFNTDGKGALDALYQKTTLKDKTILILGYGGSASAITGAILLFDKPKYVIITGRNIKKAKQLVRLLNKNIKHDSVCTTIELDKLKHDKHINITNIDIIINTTPIGMKTYQVDEIPISEDLILSKHIVMDIVYTPLMTKFLEVAKRKRATIIEGYWMLLYQAKYQMELFLNLQIEEKVINQLKKLLLKHLQ